MRRHGLLFYGSALIASAVSLAARSVSTSAESARVASPVSPQGSLKHIVVAPDLKVELAAHEPQVIDPIAIRFDELGRMWVVEMHDYPAAAANSRGGRSRISVLEDRDNDGFFETANVFANNLRCATGLQPWKGGVFVTLSGELAYFKDTDGDGKSDLKETWYKGFAEQNTQLRANDPRLALDGHIYIANGLRGGTITDARNPYGKPVSISGMDFRFDPITRAFEAVSGVSQFGLAFDDYGNRFLCSNRNPAIHVVLENHHVEKNPLVAIAAVSHDVAKAGEQSRVFPITRAWTTSNLHAGQFTAACGIEIYRGNALPKEYYGSIFVCEPTGHLVRREVMRPHGVTFTSAPAVDGVEFFASRDEWCCPVNLEVGPDGALYVVDMYRAVIEHPDFMPAELRGRKDLRQGDDRGRIYRIVPAHGFKRAAPPRVSELTSAALVDLLTHENSWWRETATRLLLERQDRSIAAKLTEMARHHYSHIARVGAIQLLKCLNVLTEDVLFAVLRDSHPRVVEQAVIAADSLVPHSKRLQNEVAELVAHADARVRFQAMLAVSYPPSLFAQSADIWELNAVLIAAGNRGGRVLHNMLANAGSLESHVANPKQFITDLSRLAAASSDVQEHSIAIEALLASNDFRNVGLASFLAATLQRGRPLSDIRATLDAGNYHKLQFMLEGARHTAANPGNSDAVRCESIDLLAAAGNVNELIATLALNEPALPVRLRAIAALASGSDLAPWRELLRRYSNETPVLQREILAGILKQSDRIALLLNEIELARIKPAQLTVNQMNQLLQHRDAEIKARSTKLFADAVPEDRQKVLKEYQTVLKLSASAERGRGAFEKHCAACHRIGNLGINVAPDISDSREKSAEQLLTDILQPNRAVDSNYFSFTAITRDGMVHTGILAAETSTSISLKQEEGKTISFRRDETEDFYSNGVSLMPDGMERLIPKQEMADLIAFIKNWRYLDDPHVFSTR